jgi:hypothetical protein
LLISRVETLSAAMTAIWSAGLLIPFSKKRGRRQTDCAAGLIQGAGNIVPRSGKNAVIL